MLPGTQSVTIASEAWTLACLMRFALHWVKGEWRCGEVRQVRQVGAKNRGATNQSWCSSRIYGFLRHLVHVSIYLPLTCSLEPASN